ncbi:MAG: glycosyltransferase [Bacteroidota bacterium]
MAQKRVLIITYYWPPSGGSGVQRWAYFAKYLERYDIVPVVLTVDPEKASYPSIDNDLLKEVEHIEVHKTSTFEPLQIYSLLTTGKKKEGIPFGSIETKSSSPVKRLGRFVRSNVMIPDARVYWNAYAYRAAKRIIKKHDISTVITTSPPHSSQLIGLKLKNKLDINWIADLRDPWTTIAYEKYLNRSKKSAFKNEHYEKAVITKCDQLIVVSEGMKEEFAEKYGASNVAVIPNGFDNEGLPKNNRPAPTDQFQLCYVGNYKISQNTTSLWKALFELSNEVEGFSENFKLSITGSLNETIKHSITTHKIEHLLEVHPFVKHREAVKIMFKANALLLPIPQAANNKLILTGKIFEYLASQNPILAIGPTDGNASKILKNCGRSDMYDYEDTDGIKTFLKEQFNYWKAHNQTSKKIEDSNYLNYSRVELTKKLANQISKLPD